MNTDHALILMGLVGIFTGFLLGYAKGNEHGKIAGRIALRKSQRALENERMVSEARESAWIKAWDSK